MPSVTFATELVPDERLRRCLLSCAFGATIVGAILILLLPVVPALKWTFLVLWSLAGLQELRSERTGMARLDRILIQADGRVDGYGGNGGAYPLYLLPGSIVLGRVAWLRMRFQDGLCYGELFAGDAAESEQWRRLLVIWRQQASVFGRPRGS